MKKKLIVISSVIAATWAAVFLAQNGHLGFSLLCTAWPAFVLWANTRKEKPRAATRGNETDEQIPVKPIYTYSMVKNGWSQEKDERWMA